MTQMQTRGPWLELRRLARPGREEPPLGVTVTRSAPIWPTARCCSADGGTEQLRNRAVHHPDELNRGAACTSARRGGSEQGRSPAPSPSLSRRAKE
jgi:hypothetical protein